MHESLIPTSIHNLQNLSAILSKAATYAETKKINEEVLLNARLFPDMLPLVRQVQIACDSAKAGAARLAEIEVPSHPDEEKSFSDVEGKNRLD